MEQRELVEWAKSGDREAFSDLARANLDRQYAVAYLILRDVDRAHDAVQEALVAAWRDLRSLRDPDAWEAWLHRLTVRACYRLARTERRRTQVELRVMPDREPRLGDPALSLAERDRGICSVEKQMISELLGAGVSLTDCRLDGAPCCRFETV